MTVFNFQKRIAVIYMIFLEVACPVGAAAAAVGTGGAVAAGIAGAAALVTQGCSLAEGRWC